MKEAVSTILVVDDEEPILDFLEIGLAMENFRIIRALTGQQALQLFRENRPDAVILDLMLPDADGLDICRNIRAVCDIPILILTARGELEDRVLGLDTGADDYLSKPFRIRELQARLRALLRRSGKSTGNTLTFGGLNLDRGTRTLLNQGRTVRLTAREFEILEMLLARPRQLLTREQILTQLWGFSYQGETNVVEVHIRSLRKKLGDEQRTLLRAVRGMGYTLGG